MDAQVVLDDFIAVGIGEFPPSVAKDFSQFGVGAIAEESFFAARFPVEFVSA